MLKCGDIFVVGEQWGKVCVLINDQGEWIDEVGFLVLVEVLGLDGMFVVGDVLNVVLIEVQVCEIVDYCINVVKDKCVVVGVVIMLDQMLVKVKVDKNVVEFLVVVKVDV